MGLKKWLKKGLNWANKWALGPIKNKVKQEKQNKRKTSTNTNINKIKYGMQ